MKRIIKKIINIMLIMGFFGLAGCSGGSMTDTRAVSKDKENLAIIYDTGENVDNVKDDITLPVEGGNGSTVAWESSDTGVIDTDGTVTRPPFGSSDVTVTLTATITKNSETETKIFTVTVLAAPALEQCDNNIDDDEDSLIDCADPDCFGDATYCAIESICGDGEDNDNDGLIDCDDSDCTGDPTYCPVESICDDDEDNDGDGLTDCDDSDCSC